MTMPLTLSASTARAVPSARILTGIFATSAVNDGLKDAAGKTLPLGLVDGHGAQLLNQAVGIGISWIIAIVGTLIALKIADLLTGTRVTVEEERDGLDSVATW